MEIGIPVVCGIPMALCCANCCCAGTLGPEALLHRSHLLDYIRSLSIRVVHARQVAIGNWPVVAVTLEGADDDTAEAWLICASELSSRDWPTSASGMMSEMMTVTCRASGDVCDRSGKRSAHLRQLKSHIGDTRTVGSFNSTEMGAHRVNIEERIQVRCRVKYHERRGWYQIERESKYCKRRRTRARACTLQYHQSERKCGTRTRELTSTPRQISQIHTDPAWTRRRGWWC